MATVLDEKQVETAAFELVEAARPAERKACAQLVALYASECNMLQNDNADRIHNTIARDTALLLAKRILDRVTTRKVEAKEQIHTNLSDVWPKRVHDLVAEGRLYYQGGSNPYYTLEAMPGLTYRIFQKDYLVKYDDGTYSVSKTGE